jgi:xylose isomerase
MDAFARGLKIASRIIEDGKIDNFIAERYRSYSEGIGKKIVEGSVGFRELERYALENEGISNSSGRQELLEAILNSYL